MGKVKDQAIEDERKKNENEPEVVFIETTRGFQKMVYIEDLEEDKEEEI